MTSTASLAADLTGLNWEPTCVEPGMRDGETGETITPGWYVLGTYPDHDSRDPAAIILHIEWAYDDEGQDITEAVARRVAKALTT